MKTFDFKAHRDQLNGFQAQLDSSKAQHGKGHPEFVKLQNKLDRDFKALDRLERDYLDHQSKIEAKVRAAVERTKAGVLETCKKRAEEIVALADKHGWERDLEVRDLTFSSLKDPECTVADFKLQLIELITNREDAKPTSRRVELGGEDPRSDEIDSLRAQLANEDDPRAKGVIARKIKNLRNQ